MPKIESYRNANEYVIQDLDEAILPSWRIPGAASQLKSRVYSPLSLQSLVWGRKFCLPSFSLSLNYCSHLSFFLLSFPFSQVPV